MKRPLCGIFSGEFLLVLARSGSNVFAGEASHSLLADARAFFE
jgi:hypothetical protein